MTEQQRWSKNFTSATIGKKTSLRLLMVGYVRDLPETVMMLDSIIADIQNKERCSRTEAITRAMIDGLLRYAEQEPISQEVLEAIEAFTFETTNVVDQARRKYAKRLYENGQIEKAQELCDRYGVDFEQTIAEYTIRMEDKSSQIREWLMNYFTVHEMDRVENIRKAIIEDGIIEVKEWSLVKNIASTDGYSGGPRGVWRKLT